MRASFRRPSGFERLRAGRVDRRLQHAILAAALVGACATQETAPTSVDGGSSGTMKGGALTSGGAAGTATGGGAGNAPMGGAGTSSVAGSAGASGTSGSQGGNGGGGSSSGNGGNAGSSAGMSGNGGSSAGMSGNGGTGGVGGAAGSGGGGSGGSAGSGGAGGTMSVEPCQNGKKDAGETDVDCGGVCAQKCAVDEGCNDISDCQANNVCEAKKCRTVGCNAANCAYSLTRVIIPSTPVTGQVVVSWSSTSLDLRFDLLDATSIDDSSNNWEDDSIEIYLDLNNGKTTSYQADDFQINVPRHAGNDVVGIGTNLNTNAVTVTRTTDADGYTLIVSVPWSALNNAPYPKGKTIGFDIGVNDDADGGQRNGQLMLFGFDQNYLNTSQFGTLDIP